MNSCDKMIISNLHLCLLYVALPFLRQTRVLLYPMTLMFIVYVISVALRWNMTLKLCNFYRSRLWCGWPVSSERRSWCERARPVNCVDTETAELLVCWTTNTSSVEICRIANTATGAELHCPSCWREEEEECVCHANKQYKQVRQLSRLAHISHADPPKAAYP